MCYSRKALGDILFEKKLSVDCLKGKSSFRKKIDHLFSPSELLKEKSDGSQLLQMSNQL